MYSPRPAGGSRLRQRVLVGLVSLGILLAAAWLTLVILTRIDDLFLPGELSLGGFTVLPGVEEAGEGPTERITILMMGLDRRASEGEAPARTDTMFVMTIDPQTETAGILGIPRDLWVDYPYPDGTCCYQERINAAYVLGETQGYWGGGTAVAMYVIEQNLGIPIDNYVLIDFEGFVDIIDALGGIDVYIEEDIYDPNYSHTERIGDYFPVGPYEAGETVHMDGITALAYARTRRNSSDLDRIRRQQQVMFAALEKARELGWNDVRKVPGLWKDYKGAIQTDVNDLLVLRYAGLASRIDLTDIASYSIGYATRPWIAPNGAAVLLPDEELIQEMVQALFTDHRLRQENARVEVQNAASADGLAARVVDFLSSQGFPSASLVPADSGDGELYTQTEIIDFSGKDYTVGRLARLLRVSQEWVRDAGPADAALRTTADADILVILGTDAPTRDLGSAASAGG